MLSKDGNIKSWQHAEYVAPVAAVVPVFPAGTIQSHYDSYYQVKNSDMTRRNSVFRWKKMPFYLREIKLNK